MRAQARARAHAPAQQWARAQTCAHALLRGHASVRASTPTRERTGHALAHAHATKRVRAQTGAKHSLLRPETVESLLVLWRVTGDARYREWGWQIFESLEAHAKVPSGGFSPVKDVTASRLRLEGRMESFFTAETLKYLYLLFGDGAQYRLDEFVFNTEAHPLRIHPEYEWGAKWGSVPSVAELDAALENGGDLWQFGYTARSGV